MISKLLLSVLLFQATGVEEQFKKIKETSQQIKLVVYSNKSDKQKVEELQKLAVQLSFEIEELDGK